MSMQLSTDKQNEAFSLRGVGQQDRLLEQPKGWVRHRRLFIFTLLGVAALVLLVLMAIRFSGAQNSVDRSRLIIGAVERGKFIRDVAADGQIVAAMSPTLYAPAPGTITLTAHPGDVVTKGQILGSIDSPDLTAKLSQEEATLQSLDLGWRRAGVAAARERAQLRDLFQQAEVDLKTAQRESERSRKAFEVGAYSEIQMLRAQDAAEKAQIGYQQAKSNYEGQLDQSSFDVNSQKALLNRQQFLVADLRRLVKGLQIRSPLDGTVGQVLVADRANISKDTPLITVIDLSALEVEIKVRESLARDLAPGMVADLQGDGHHWEAVVKAVSPEVVSGEVAARLSFAGQKPDGLRQSQRLSVRILIEQRDNVLMVDRGRFVDQDGPGVAYVVSGDMAERRTVRLGPSSVQKVEILDGLKEGEQVVVSGTDAFNGAARVILSD